MINRPAKKGMNKPDAEMEAFLKEYEEATTPIIKKHSMRLIPRVINLSNEIKVHYEAAFAVQRFTHEEIKVQKANETLDTKPEVDNGTNKND